MEARGVTCRNERDRKGQWWIVWSADFIGDKSGRKPHPESVFLEDAYRAGIRKAVDYLKMRYCIVATEEMIKKIEEDE